MELKPAKPKLVIKKFPDQVLLVPCTPVTKFNENLHAVLDEMAIVMNSNNGIGLAANQVGIPKRFFIMLDSRNKIVEFINPKIVEREGVANMPEGCLSLPGYYLVADRAEVVTVEAQNRHGETFKVVADGIESICLQHEYDHLDGIFYTSKEKKSAEREK